MPIDSPAEEWRDVSGFAGYQVSNFGRVRSFWRRVSGGAGSTFDKWRWAITDNSKILPLHLNTDGYRTALLSKDGKQHRRPMHLLVLSTFVGPRPEGLQGRHLNDDKENNHISNLAWGTASKNIQERHTNRTTPVFKLTPQDVLDIRNRLADGERQHSIAKAYNVHQCLISRINSGQRWSFIT